MIDFIGIIFHSRQLHSVIQFVKKILLQIKPYDLLIMLDDAQVFTKLEDVIIEVFLFTKERFFVILGMYKTMSLTMLLTFLFPFSMVTSRFPMPITSNVVSFPIYIHMNTILV